MIGFPRAARMLMGREKFHMNPRILREGHQRHYTDTPRTRHFGRKTYKTKQYYGNKKRRRHRRRRQRSVPTNHWFWDYQKMVLWLKPLDWERNIVNKFVFGKRIKRTQEMVGIGCQFFLLVFIISEILENCIENY